MQGDESKSGMEVAVAERRCEVINLAAWRQRLNLQHAHSPFAEAQRMGSRQEASAEVIAWRPRPHAVATDRPSLVLGQAARRLESAAGTISGVESMQQILHDMRREIDTLETIVRPAPAAAVIAQAVPDRRTAAMPRWMLEYFLLDAPGR